jgi:hypothetical protein
MNLNRPQTVRLLVLVAAVLFGLALLVAEGWLTKGTWQEWTSGGLVSLALAQVFGE